MSNEQIDIFYSRDNLSNYFPTYRKDVLVAALRSSSTIARQNRIYSSIEQRTSEFQPRTCMSVYKQQATWRRIPKHGHLIGHVISASGKVPRN